MDLSGFFQFQFCEFSINAFHAHYGFIILLNHLCTCTVMSYVHTVTEQYTVESVRLYCVKLNYQCVELWLSTLVIKLVTLLNNLVTCHNSVHLLTDD